MSERDLAEVEEFLKILVGRMTESGPSLIRTIRALRFELEFRGIPTDRVVELENKVSKTVDI